MVRKSRATNFSKQKSNQTVLGDLEGDLGSVFDNTIDRVIFAAGSAGKNVIG
jgi:hypothetical protein